LSLKWSSLNSNGDGSDGCVGMQNWRRPGIQVGRELSCCCCCCRCGVYIVDFWSAPLFISLPKQLSVRQLRMRAKRIQRWRARAVLD
jgi:hypothetical protein